MIHTEHLTKTFGKFTAVEDINLDIKAGDIYALIGPNGAGKTTLVKMLTGLLEPSSGTASIAGFNIRTHPVHAKTAFGYVPDDPPGYEFLSGMEFLIFTGRLRGMKDSSLTHRIGELKHIFPVADSLYKPMGEYSRGVKQKIAILAALLSRPRVLIVDEPIVGLDPPAINTFSDILRHFAAGGGSVLFVTHILEFARVATRVGVMKEGKIVREEKMTKTLHLESLV